MPMTDRFLPYGRQVIDDDDVAAVAAVLRGDCLTTGPTVEAFEKAFAARVGARFAVACSSGTAGLHLAMLALGLGDGSRAIVPSMTFLATANAARYVGAEIVFADVDGETGLLGAAELEAALARESGGVCAVVPVHLTGRTVDMPALARIAARDGFVIVEDACHALGTTYQDGGETISVGSCRHSAAAVFSFHPVKTIAMGEGGAVTTNDPGLYERLTRFRNHGMTRVPADFRNTDLAFGSGGEPNPWYYEMPEVGFNYRASDIHCALALSQLGKLDRFVERRRTLAERYDQLLKPVAPIILPPKRSPACTAALHLYSVQIDFPALGLPRETVMRHLKDAGIGTQVHYIPVHTQPYYRERSGELQLPGAMAYYRATLSLPLFASMDDSDVRRVVGALEECVALARPRSGR